MNIWTALLESLHSALIDELTERYPEPKPTLGMPLRQKQPLAPPSITKLLLCEVLVGEGLAGVPDARGTAMLAFEPAFMKALKTQPAEFWQAILGRAGAEFGRRSIRPRIGKPQELATQGGAPIQLPNGFGEPTRVIWIPFQVPEGCCYLGVAI